MVRRIWILGGLAALSACGGNTPSGQVVATVNGEEITRSEVNAALPSNTPSDPKVAAQSRNAVLEQIVAQRIVSQEAKREQLDKSEPFLLAKRRAEAQILAELMKGRVLQSMHTPDDSAVAQYVEANPTRFRDRVLFQTSQVKTTLSAINPSTLKDVHSLDGVRARLEATGAPIAQGGQTIDSAVLTPTVTRQLLQLPAGEPFITTEGGVLVASVVTGTQTVPLAGDKAHNLATNLMKQEAGFTALKKRYDALRKNAKVQYQSGFAPVPLSATTTSTQ